MKKTILTTAWNKMGLKRREGVFISPLSWYCAFIGVSFPYLLIYYKNIGLTSSEAGRLISMQGLVVIFIQQFWGYLADEVTGARALLKTTSVISMFLYLAMMFTVNYYLLLILVMLFFAFNIPNMQMLNSLFLRQYKSKDKYSFVRSFGSFAFVITNLLTGKIIDITGAQWVIFPMGVLIIFFMRLSVNHLPELPRKKSAKRISFVEIQKYFLGNSQIRLFLLSIFFFQVVYSVCYYFLSIQIQELGGTKTQVAWAYSFAALIELPLFMYMRVLVKKHGELLLIKIAIITQIIRWAGVYFATAYFHIIILQILHPVSFGFFYLGTVMYMNKLAGKRHHSSAQTLHSMVYSGLGSFTGNFFGGKIVDVYGLKSLYLIGAVVSVISFIIFLYFAKGEQKHGLRKAHD